jgi:23S rRNA pseudouridine2605 synthase
MANQNKNRSNTNRFNSKSKSGFSKPATHSSSRPTKKSFSPKRSKDQRNNTSDEKKVIEMKGNRRKLSDPSQGQEVRLNKYIADSGKSSRRKADELIEKGLVKVNGKVVTELGTKITAADEVTVAGDPVSYRRRDIYILLNKPKNAISTVKDEKKRKTVMDIIKNQERLFPVGRLDRNTTGVLLVTNDGELSNRLTHPSYKIERMYVVGLDKNLSAEHAQEIVKGVELEDGPTAPCHIMIDPKDRKRIEMTMTEGKNHEVKRIFAKFGYEVVKLDRKVFAGLSNRGMSRGEYKYLNFKEVQALKKLVKLR